MAEQDPKMPDQWIDTDAGLERAQDVRRHADILSRILRAGEEYWDGIGQRNSFRERWAQATRRRP